MLPFITSLPKSRGIDDSYYIPNPFGLRGQLLVSSKALKLAPNNLQMAIVSGAQAVLVIDFSWGEIACKLARILKHVIPRLWFLLTSPVFNMSFP